jgi:hypothetical protein
MNALTAEVRKNGYGSLLKVVIVKPFVNARNVGSFMEIMNKKSLVDKIVEESGIKITDKCLNDHCQSYNTYRFIEGFITTIDNRIVVKCRDCGASWYLDSIGWRDVK